MIIKDGKSYINGNTVLSPERKANEPLRKEQYDKLRKAQLERESRIKKEQLKKKKSTIQVITFIFALGLILIGRYAMIFNMQKNLSTIKKEIEVVNAQNEALKVDILRISSFEKVKNTSEKQLKMIEPDKNNALIMDLSKDNFKDSKAQDAKAKSIIEKLKKYLF